MRRTSRLDLASRYALCVAAQVAAVALLQFGLGWGLAGILVTPWVSVFSAFVLLRPRSVAPEPETVRDWGRTLGHSWVSDGQRLAFLPPSSVRELAADARPAQNTGTFDLQLSLASRSSGLPPLRSTVLWALLVHLGACAVGFLWSLQTTHLTPLEVFRAVGLLSVALQLFQLPAWVMLGAVHLMTRTGRPTPIKVAGNTLHAGTRTFTIGHPDGRAELGDGVLTLTNPREKLVLRGENATLHHLKEVVEGRQTEDANAVPDALGAMLSTRAQREGG